jgi:RNA polymerase sigma-70 factor (ECF subfamily)
MQDDADPLVDRVRAGDVAALTAYIEARRPQWLAYIERRLGPALRRKVEADDIFQEASAEAVRSLGEMDLSHREPFGWLCQVAERKIVDAHRRYVASQKRAAGREVSIDGGGPSGDDSGHAGLVQLLVASMTTASQAFSRNQREHRLLEALAQMPQEQREALRLRYLEGLPSKEVAQRLGKTDGAVRVMLTRALGKLQQLLGPEAAP